MTARSSILFAALLMAASPSPGASREVLAASPTPHGTVPCNSCHLQAREAKGGLEATAERRCTSCHDVRPSERGPFHSARRSGCLGCHSYHEPGRLSAGTDVGDLETVRATAADHCRSCHVVGGLATLSAAHREAAARYHGDTGAIAGQSPSQGCLNCHVREARSPWRGSSQKRQLRFYLHSSHPQGIRVIPGSGRGAARIRSTIDPALPLFDGRIECQTCHDLTVETRFLLIAFAEQDGLCLGCHRVGPERTAGGNAVAALTPAR